MAKVPSVATGGSSIVEGTPENNNAVMVPRTLVTPSNQMAPVHVLNTRPEGITVRKALPLL